MIDALDSAYALLFCGLLLLESVLFGALGVVFQEQTEGGEAKQKGLDEPQAASDHVGDAFVTAGVQRRNNELQLSWQLFCSFCVQIPTVVAHPHSL